MIFIRKSSHQTHKNKTKKLKFYIGQQLGWHRQSTKTISAYGQNKPTSITLILTAVKQVYQSMEHRMLSSTNQIQLYVTKLRLSQKVISLPFFLCITVLLHYMVTDYQSILFPHQD